MEFYNHFYIYSYSIRKIKSLLKNVVPRTDDERQAFNYWSLFVEKFNNVDYKHLFISESRKNKLDVSSSFLDVILKSNFKLYIFNIYQNVDINSKYDIVYVSNISEWLLNNIGGFSAFENNLYNLLNDRGMVLASHVSYSGVADDELLAFQKRFQYEELDQEKILGYVYRKK